MRKVRVAIIGATGFAGEKLIKILSQHRLVELVSLSCRINQSKPLQAQYPEFKLKFNLDPIDPEIIAQKAELIFLALPHTVSLNYVGGFLKKGKIVIDLSADYRLKDRALYQKYYGIKHPDFANALKAAYGLPELYRRQIRSAKLIANPGCYPTANILGLAPLVSKKLVGNIIIDAKSGISGAGRAAYLDFVNSDPERYLYAYKLFQHQHLAEMTQIINSLSRQKQKIIFTPHVVPLKQGILTTIYADLTKKLTEKDVLMIYKDFYKNEYFVRIKTDSLPKISDIYESNFCDISFAVENKKIIIISAIDNLMRGAATQAVQNMNIVLGFNEKEGLV